MIVLLYLVLFLNCGYRTTNCPQTTKYTYMQSYQMTESDDLTVGFALCIMQFCSLMPWQKSAASFVSACSSLQVP